MKTLKPPLKEKYQMNILFLNINSIQILIILFFIIGQKIKSHSGSGNKSWFLSSGFQYY